MKHLWVALVVLTLSAFLPGEMSAQGNSPPSGKARGPGLELFQNYPNPFNPATKIKFDIPSIVNSELSIVNLNVFDLLGKQVRVLVNEKLSAGSYEVQFDGSELTSGIYFYKLETGNFKEVKRMIFIK